jgi:hypothetical protein
MTSLLEMVKLSSSLKRKKKVAECIKAIKEKLEDIPDLNEFRNTDELTEIVCNIVENLLAKKAKKYKINKKECVFEVYKELFIRQPLSEPEKEALGKRIEYLHEKGLKHSVAILKWASKGILQWLVKKCA